MVLRAAMYHLIFVVVKNTKNTLIKNDSTKLCNNYTGYNAGVCVI